MSAQILQKQDEHNMRNHENSLPSRVSPQWFSGNPCTWARDDMVIHTLINIHYMMYI